MRYTVLALLILVLTLASDTSTHADGNVRIRALLIGINNYATWPDLRGPSHDVEEFKTALISRFHADPLRIVELPEAEATRPGIEKALQQLVASSSAGDTVVFYYAGHGSVVPDIYGEDLDGLNQCIVPIDTPDYDKPGYDSKVVRGHFIAEQLAAAVKRVRPDPAASGSVVFVFDSCHSGGMSRAPVGTERIRSVHGVREYFLEKIGKAPVNKPLMATPHQAGPHGWVVLSACSNEQEAKDAPSFTHRLVAALQRGELTSKSDYNDLMQLIGRDDTQTPQLDGDRTLSILGGSAEPRTPAIQVMAVEKATATDFHLHLDEGALLGVNTGAKLAVYRFGTRSPSDKQNFLGDAQVLDTDETTPYSAVASMPGAGVDETALAHAVVFVTEPAFGLSRKVKLAFGADFPQNGRYGEVRERLGQHFAGSVSVVGLQDSPDIVLFSSDPDGTPGVLTVERNIIPPSILVKVPATDEAAASRVEETVKNVISQQAFEDFVSPDAPITLKIMPGHFTAPPHVDSFREDKDAQRGPDGNWHFASGQQVLVDMTNRSPQPLYISLLTLNPAKGTIEVLYPNETEAGGSWKPLPAGESFKLPLRLTAGQDEGSAGHDESIKVLATSEPIPVRRLATRGARSASTVQGPLAQFMATVADGTTRSAEVMRESGPFYATPSQWWHIAPAKTNL